jgi:hypothetical protein
LPKVLKEAQDKELEQQQQQEEEEEPSDQEPDLQLMPSGAAGAAATAAAAKPIDVPEVFTQDVIKYWNSTDDIIAKMFNRWGAGVFNMHTLSSFTCPKPTLCTPETALDMASGLIGCARQFQH